MKFGEQIREIRKSENLTQEQFAEKLHVTRQAVSNWENDKNLPDIEMLILISNEFHVSLDTLIKGDGQMNNVTEKIIRDGSETRCARYNAISSVIGGGLLLLGVLLLVIKGLSVEYIDASGILHENFFLIPTAWLCMISGAVAFLSVGVRSIAGKVKERHPLGLSKTIKKVTDERTK